MKKRVLITGYTNNFGGIERTISALYLLHINDYVFDFLCSKNNDNIKLDSKFCENGSKIYHFETSIKKSKKNLKKFLKNNHTKYEAIVVNFGDLTDSIILKYAKKYRIKNRIGYAHMGYYRANNVVRRLLLFYCKVITHFCATSLFSYSNVATDVTYLKCDKKRTKIYFPFLPELFVFDTESRKDLRAKYNLGEEDVVVVGCIGSISPNKNQISLLNTISKLESKLEIKIKLFFIGDIVDKEYGETFNKNLERYKKIAVHINNQLSVDKYYSMFDIYISASKKEGYGLTVLEAFTSDLPIIVNKDSIPLELIKKTNALEVDICNERDMLLALDKCISLLRSGNKRRRKNVSFINKNNLVFFDKE